MFSAALNSYIEPVFIFKSRLISTYIRKSLLRHAILQIFKQTKKNTLNKQTLIGMPGYLSKIFFKASELNRLHTIIPNVFNKKCASIAHILRL